MAEKVEILNIETKTLANLRAELKELKKQLEQMVIGSEEYNNTLQELTNRQKELSSATKSSVADMEGSYNALSKELAELRKAWKATNDEAERSNLGARMSEINSQLKDLDASVGNFQRNVGNYSSALDGLDDKVKEVTDAYDANIESSNKLVESSDQLDKTMIAVVSAFAMVGPALEMMGVEGEEAEKIMSKLQTVMAITAGFKAIAEGAKGFTQLSKSIKLASISLGGFKTALVATGIGAAVVAIGLLAANWEKVSIALGLAKKEQEKFNAEYFKIADNDFDLNQRIAEAEGQLEEASIRNRQRYYRKMMEDAQAARDSIKDINSQAYKDAIAEEQRYYDLLKKANDDYSVYEAKKRKENKDKVKESLNQLKAERKTVLEEIKALEEEPTGLEGIKKTYNERLKYFQQARAKRLITLKEYEEAEKLLRKRYNDQLTQLQIQQAEEELQRLEDEANGRLSMIDKINKDFQIKSLSEMDEYNDKLTDLSIANDESGIYELNRQFIDSQIRALEELKEVLSAYGDEAKDTIIEIDSEIANLKTQDKQLVADEDNRQLESLNETLGILVETADAVGSAWTNVFSSIQEGIVKVGDSINKGEKGWTKYGKIASAGLGVAADMLGSLAAMQDTQTEEGFEKSKKLSIAQATMSMLTGIVNTWTSVMSKENAWMTIWGQVATGSALSAMILATGLAQINQIKSTTFEGGGSGAAASPSITALNAIQSPVDMVSNVQGASTEADIEDRRVYVLESDIASTTKKVNVAQSEATF